MTIHHNSITAFHSLNQGERRAKILSVYAESGRPLTDREVMHRLGVSDMNHVRPRITELTDDEFLYEVDSVKCDVTGRPVRRSSFTGLVSKSNQFAGRK